MNRSRIGAIAFALTLLSSWPGVALLAQTPPPPPVLSEEQEALLAALTRVDAVLPRDLGSESVGHRRRPTVLKHLDLTEKQKAKIKELDKAKMKRIRESAEAAADRAGSVNVGDEVAPVDWESEHQAAIYRVLTRSQRGRLSQIALRKQGPWSVADPAIAKRIGLNPGQEVRLGDILDRARAAHARLLEDYHQRPVSAGGFEDKLRELEGLRREAEGIQNEASKQVRRVLTRKQRAALDAMNGAPFNTSRPEATLEEHRPDAAADPAGDISGRGRPQVR